MAGSDPLLSQELTELQREKKISDAQNALFEMFINMARSSSEDEVLKATMENALELAAQMANAELGSIFLLNAHGVVTDSILTRNQIQGEKRSSLIGTVLDTGLAGWVKKNLKVALVTDAENDDRWVTFKDQTYIANSALSVPILRHDTLFGIMTLLHSQKEHFNDACVDITQKAANQMAIAIENAQLYIKLEKANQAIETYSKALQFELDQGRKIQKDFLPSCLPESDHCDMHAFFTPALKLSGDFYDVFELPGDHMGFAVGDVSGKGVGSALFMALTRSLLRIFSGTFVSGTRINDFTTPFNPLKALAALPRINDYISSQHCDDGMFVTLFFGILHPPSGRVWYINAGHEPLLIVNQEGLKETLAATGPALGPIREAEYETGEIMLEKGDFLIGFTDGVTEARSSDRDFYTRDRVIETIDNQMTLEKNPSSETIVRAIQEDLSRFIGNAPQSDDVTILAVKRV